MPVVPTLVVQVQPDSRNLQECHLIYFGEPSAIGPASQADLLMRLASSAFLTVRKRGRIHPVINTNAIERAELRIGAKLLNFATLTRDGKGRGQ